MPDFSAPSLPINRTLVKISEQSPMVLLVNVFVWKTSFKENILHWELLYQFFASM